jgi:nitroreductase
MVINLKKITKFLLGEKLINYVRQYFLVPRLLFNELLRLNSLIRNRQKYISDPEVKLASIRTRAHIVDKGLQAFNWEVGRGRNPYLQLCREIDTFKGLDLIQDPSFLWALQKRSEYEVFQKNGKILVETSNKSTQSTFDKNELLNLIKSRRTVRTFDDKIIDTEILKEFADVINWSPTSCNRQPAKLFFTQNAEKVIKCINQCAGATCFSDVTPCFVSVCADTRFYKIIDRDLPFIDVSLGIQNMLLLGHAQGIGAAILNWMHHTSEEDATLRETLEIPDYYSIIFNLIMGYSSECPPVPLRKNIKMACEIVS